MGWNSWDAYGLTIDEAQFRANAEVVRGLEPFGWTYVVIDEGWYMGRPAGDRLETRDYRLDAHGLLVPAPERFPSAADGAGFKPLADWVHAQGLKFGLHIVRGIPKAAVQADLPIAGSSFHAPDAADMQETCPWDDGNFGVKDNAAGQAYYDSVIRLYAGWGVDFLKVDCIADHPFRESEIRQISAAIAKSGRPMILSLSPGPAQFAHADTFVQTAQMWRIANDLWDGWSFPHEKPTDDFPNGVRAMFDSLAAWAPYRRPGRWPDPDMLPFGALSPHPGWGEPRRSRLTTDEARSLFTLDAIAGAPLILGGDLTAMDAEERAMLTNADVLALDRRVNGRPLDHPPAALAKARVWVSAADGAGRPDTVAVFNLGDESLVALTGWGDLGLEPGPHAARNLWTGVRLGRSARIKLDLPAHGVALYRIE